MEKFWVEIYIVWKWKTNQKPHENQLHCSNRRNTTRRKETTTPIQKWRCVALGFCLVDGTSRVWLWLVPFCDFFFYLSFFFFRCICAYTFHYFYSYAYIVHNYINFWWYLSFKYDCFFVFFLFVRTLLLLLRSFSLCACLNVVVVIKLSVWSFCRVIIADRLKIVCINFIFFRFTIRNSYERNRLFSQQ